MLSCEVSHSPKLYFLTCQACLRKGHIRLSADSECTSEGKIGRIGAFEGVGDTQKRNWPTCLPTHMPASSSYGHAGAQVGGVGEDHQKTNESWLVAHYSFISTASGLSRVSHRACCCRNLTHALPGHRTVTTSSLGRALPLPCFWWQLV